MADRLSRHFLGRCMLLGVLATSGMATARAAHPAAIAVVATIVIDRVPMAAAVDTRTGHVFIASVLHGNEFGNATGPGTLTTLDARSGHILRVSPIAAGPRSIAVDSKTSRVFVLCFGKADRYGLALGKSSVTMLDARTGAPIRTVGVGQGFITTGQNPTPIAVDAETGRVFVANQQDNSVSVLDARSGNVLATTQVGTLPVSLAIAARTGRVFVLNNNDPTVSVLDATSGKVVATTTVGDRPTAVTVDEPSGHVFVSGSPAEKPGTLSMLDARTGAVLHVGTTGVGPKVAVDSAAVGRVFVIAFGDGMHPGSVGSVDAATGATIRTTHVGTGPLGGAVAHSGKMVLVVNYNDPSMTALDARSGAVLGTVPVGVGPEAVAVDDASGRAFLAVAGSDLAHGEVDVLALH